MNIYSQNYKTQCPETIQNHLIQFFKSTPNNNNITTINFTYITTESSEIVHDSR